MAFLFFYQYGHILADSPVDKQILLFQAGDKRRGQSLAGVHAIFQIGHLTDAFQSESQIVLALG